MPRIYVPKWEQLEWLAARMRRRYLSTGKGCATRRKVVERRLSVKQRETGRGAIVSGVVVSGDEAAVKIA